MQIDTISYERRVSDGQYGNRMVHASATLDEGEDVLTAAATVRAFVADQIERDIAEEDARREAERLAREAEYKRRREEEDRQYRERVAAMGQQSADDREDDRASIDDDDDDDD